jgi:dephospho-CoA kinase
VLRVALTGGIASGKSTIARFFRELGVPIIDTDSIARQVVAPGEPGLAAVRQAFGDRVIASSGELDRRALRRIVFRDAGERRRLEAILHPLIRERAARALEASEGDYTIVVVPLLAETDFGALVDRIAVVDCPREQQLERLTGRDDISTSEAQAMLGAQADRETRIALADDIIDNAGDLEATRQQVERLHRRYLDLARVYRN